MKILAYVLTGLFAAVSGIVMTARLGSASVTAGTGMELRVITAVIIGGASLQGGEGSVLGAFLGTFLMALITNALTLLGVDVYWQTFVIGGTLLTAVLIDTLSKNIRPWHKETVMTGKEILQNALNHKDGPVPVDFGATSVTGMHCSVVEGLREYYGLEKRPVKIHEPYQMLGFIEEDLQEAIGINVSGVFARKNMFGFSNENWKEWRTPWNQTVLVPGDYNVSVEGKDVYIYPEGDTSVPPSGRMPESGYFYDAIVRQPEIDDDSLNPKITLKNSAPSVRRIWFISRPPATRPRKPDRVLSQPSEAPPSVISLWFRLRF